MGIEVQSDCVTLDGFVVARLTNDVPATIQDRFRTILETAPDEDDVIISRGDANDAEDALEALRAALETAVSDLNDAMPDFT